MFFFFCETARENGEARALPLADHAYGASRLPKATVLQSRKHDVCTYNDKKVIKLRFDNFSDEFSDIHR